MKVLGARWKDMLAGIRAAANVESVLAAHGDFLARAAEECFLHDRALREQLDAMLDAVHLFAAAGASSADASRARDCFLEARARLQAILAASPAQAYRSLLMRLDYNGYYAGKAGVAAAAAGAGALLSDADASSDEEDAPEPLRPTGFRWQNTRGLVE